MVLNYKGALVQLSFMYSILQYILFVLYSSSYGRRTVPLKNLVVIFFLNINSIIRHDLLLIVLSSMILFINHFIIYPI